MLVLLDLEWVENQAGHCGPTQVAARRVDAAWNTAEDFYAQIRPRDQTFHRWDHMAYSGGTPENFLYAKSAYSVLSDLRAWLRPNDILCWWSSEPREVFQKLNALILKGKATQQSYVLDGCVARFLDGQQLGSPYQLAVERGIPVPSPAHCAKNDVEAMQTVLRAIGLPQSAVLAPAPKKAQQSLARQEDRPYQYEVETGLIHRRGCACIPEGAQLQGFETLKTCLRRGYRPCPYCAAEDYRRARRERAQGIIDRSDYNFVYTPGSEVFHRYDCPLILSATHILGSVYYEKCVETGRRPCKLCRPSPEDPLRPRPAGPAPKAAEGPPRPLTPPKKQSEAEHRQRQAREDRRAGLSAEGLTEGERDDIFTLTATRYGFWAAAGYRNFHLRGCPKLRDLANIRGFSRYKDAVRAGLTPCKLCRPTPKNDVVYSIPIKSQRRRDESVEDLVALCRQHGYTYEWKKSSFTLWTPVGRWRIDLTSMPIVLDHINLTRVPDNENLYHRQPRLFLSLLDAFQYIQRHDQTLQARRMSPQTEGETGGGTPGEE